MTAIFVEDSFDSAHWLPNVPGGHKCKAMHGHTYRIRLEVSGDVGAETGGEKPRNRQMDLFEGVDGIPCS